MRKEARAVRPIDGWNKAAVGQVRALGMARPIG